MAEKAGVNAKAQESKQKCSNSCKRKPNYNSSISPADRVLKLQRTAGNQVVQRLIESGTLQAKLRIGQPNDIHEQEADRITERVMRMPDVTLYTGATRIQRKCPKCRDDKRDEKLQAKKTSGKSPEVITHIEADISSMRGGGQPLPESVRAFFEPRFGHDFSQVRMHTDSKAAESARLVNAQAYTVGKDVVFGEGQYVPGSSKGNRLLAHELTHVIHQSGSDGIHIDRGDEKLDLSPIPNVLRSTDDISIARQIDEKEEKPKKKNAEDSSPAVDTSLPSTDTSQADVLSGEASTSTTSTPSSSAAAQTSVTSGGHTPAPPGLAPCPDAPSRNIIIIGCTDTPSSPPVVTEKAILPSPNPGRFGGDSDRAKFAKQLAQCRAEREVKEEIEKRFLADVTKAKKIATEEAKADTEAAIKAATENLDPKDKGAINRAKAKATADAKKAAAKKIAAAQAAITRQDIATVTTELATKHEDKLAEDYDNTIKGSLERFGAGWLGVMQKKLETEHKRIIKEKSAKPKGSKGDVPPPAKSADEIAAEVEAEMVQVRCDRREWVLNQMEGISHAWAAGRREQVDFLTITQKAAYLKNFKPAYEVAPSDLVEIPASLQPDIKARKGVAPELADFLSQLADDPNTPSFTASNRPGHGGGSWAGKGFSTDLFLNAPKDQRGFWEHSIAVRFLLALDSTAKKMGARWRVLYDDFGVAQEVNQITGSRNVVFMGESGSRLNWHGPDPLILHFHLDLEIPQKTTTENRP